MTARTLLRRLQHWRMSHFVIPLQPSGGGVLTFAVLVLRRPTAAARPISSRWGPLGDRRALTAAAAAAPAVLAPLLLLTLPAGTCAGCQGCSRRCGESMSDKHHV